MRNDLASEKPAKYREVRNADELHAALAGPRAMIYLSVDWAMQSKYSELDILAVSQAWRNENPHLEVPLFRIDLTEQGDAPLWNAVEAWLGRKNELSALMSAGAGSLFWINRGNVATFSTYPHADGRVALLEKTRVIFGST